MHILHAIYSIFPFSPSPSALSSRWMLRKIYDIVLRRFSSSFLQLQFKVVFFPHPLKVSAVASSSGSELVRLRGWEMKAANAHFSGCESIGRRKENCVRLLRINPFQRVQCVKDSTKKIILVYFPLSPSPFERYCVQYCILRPWTGINLSSARARGRERAKAREHQAEEIIINVMKVSWDVAISPKLMDAAAGSGFLWCLRASVGNLQIFLRRTPLIAPRRSQFTN